jgi:hypothetical protein
MKERIETMGMGFAGVQTNAISLKDLAKICPKETAAFEQAIVNAGTTLNDFCQQAQYEEEDESATEDDQKVDKAWDKLAKAFTAATMTEGEGLEIEPNYHNSDDEGDRYDEVNGGFIEVLGVTAVTPAGKKFEKFIEHVSYVQFG